MVDSAIVMRFFVRADRSSSTSSIDVYSLLNNGSTASSVRLA